jgi:hypothetical protein
MCPRNVGSRQGTCGPGGAVCGSRGVGQRGQLDRPIVEQPPQPGPAQRPQEGATLDGSPPREVCLEWLQVGGRSGQQPAGHLGQAELVHVQIADRGGEIAEPLEPRLPRLSQVRRERRPAELEQGSGTPDRDADVVEELGVDVADRAGEVDADLLQEVGQLGGQQETRR